MSHYSELVSEPGPDIVQRHIRIFDLYEPDVFILRAHEQAAQQPIFEAEPDGPTWHEVVRPLLRLRCRKRSHTPGIPIIVTELPSASVVVTSVRLVVRLVTLRATSMRPTASPPNM